MSINLPAGTLVEASWRGGVSMYPAASGRHDWLNFVSSMLVGYVMDNGRNWMAVVIPFGETRIGFVDPDHLTHDYPRRPGAR